MCIVRAMYLKCFQFMINRNIICVTRNLSCDTFSEIFSSRRKEFERKWQFSKIQILNFHTTQKLNAPIVLVVEANCREAKRVQKIMFGKKTYIFWFLGFVLCSYTDILLNEF